MKKLLRKFYYKIFKCYEILERKYVSYQEADQLMLNYDGKPSHEKWVIDNEKEDHNNSLYWVYICRKKRILE